MAQPTSDPIALDVAKDVDHLLEHGVVEFCGYVKTFTKADGTVDANFRVYTSSSFDRWLEIRGSDLRAQLPGSDETAGRSLVWVAADAVVTQCQSASAGYLSQVMDAGGDDPTAYPRGRRS